MNLLIEEMESKDLKQDVFNRLVMFKDHVGMNLNAFSARIGMEQSTLHYQFHGKRALSLDTIINTLSAYDELSAEWLLRGKGEMQILESSGEDVEHKADNRLDALVDTITLLQETIKMKNATNDALQAELSQYKHKAKKA